MESSLLDKQTSRSIALRPVASEEFGAWLESQPERVRTWLGHSGFRGARDTFSAVPDAQGQLDHIVVGIESPADPWCLGALPPALPEGDYHLDVDWPADALTHAAIGWGLGAYRYARYKEPKRAMARLALDPRCEHAHVENVVAGVVLARDLINTPAEHMMPEHLDRAMSELGETYGARVARIEGDALLEANYPAIHAVGRASRHPPRLIELSWGEASRPKLTLVGKGVCFDSGGLDLKTAQGMRLMKKDMGGAAHAIALAQLVMRGEVAVNLRVLVPAVENAVSGDAYRPGDVIRTRNGLTVEIDNTDAEGRVILADALAEACAGRPDVLFDFATLTGAARVALGTEVPALFCNRDDLAQALLDASTRAADDVWRLPLHRPYRELIEGKFSDIVNSTSTPFAGAITAALFLEEFVAEGVPWAHFDLMAWNLRSRPGRPEGGEAMGLRGIYEYVRTRYGR